MKGEPRIPVCFSLPAKDQWILEAFDRLARMKYGRRGRSKLIKRALMEYLNRHSQGNPQKLLEIVEPPFIVQARLEAGVRFMRSKSGLPLRKIAKITGYSYRRVRAICKDINVKATRTKGGFLLGPYREAWKKFKVGVPPEEAFRF